MKSFRTELENPVVEKDIIELEKKIHKFKNGDLDEDSFRSLRLARGVYGQRQPGVQMVRIKLPYGKVSSKQLHRMSDVSDEYSTGNLHITTRQDIQIHYVSLDDTPELWNKLEQDRITLREACGNTVRNVTASPFSGIDPKEPFDVIPYAHAFFEYFLRNPICQEMGRKFKVSFSSSEEDQALSFIHDLGFIPKIKKENGKEIRGFKVLIGGGIGSQPAYAQVAFEFLETDQIIPFSEGALRVFDRHGERARRAKARFKFLVKDEGLPRIMDMIYEERLALKNKRYPIKVPSKPKIVSIDKSKIEIPDLKGNKNYELWKKTNLFPQKQSGYFAVGLKIKTGDLSTKIARVLADLVQSFAQGEIRLTISQGIIIPFVEQELLPFFYSELEKLNLADPGYDSILDVTACPGTDTCNLGIASSMGVAKELERILHEEYFDLVANRKLNIKISGCMNACGQHAIANIGFQGMTVKSGKLVAPALQVLLGGGAIGDGSGRFADKLLKIPSKRAPAALRMILDDYQEHAHPGEYFNDYYDRQGKDYFYQLLKGLTNTENLTQDDFIDWGNDDQYVKAIGVGECAGVVVDLVSTLLEDAKEKLINAEMDLQSEKYADSIYRSYTSLINTAKALLTTTKSKTNTQSAIVRAFDEEFISNKKILLETSFHELVYQIRHKEPTKQFAENYLAKAQNFFAKIKEYRNYEVAV